MRCACIDIGSNTTRVLVADVEGGVLREVVCEKAFTRLGTALRRTGALPPEAMAAVADVVAVQTAVARSLGAGCLRVVATAAIRAASNRDALVRAVRERAGVEVEILGAADEAHFAFAGGTHAHRTRLEGRVAVVDVGGGSSEIAVGRLADGVEWSISIALGSSSLADEHLRSDPPAADELAAAGRAAAAMFATLTPPPVDAAVAVGGSATSMARLAGDRIDPATVAHALELLASRTRGDVAAQHGLDPERVRLLPAGLQILGAAAARLGHPLVVGEGGLREGVCLAIAAAR